MQADPTHTDTRIHARARAHTHTQQAIRTHFPGKFRRLHNGDPLLKEYLDDHKCRRVRGKPRFENGKFCYPIHGLMVTMKPGSWYDNYFRYAIAATMAGAARFPLAMNRLEEGGVGKTRGWKQRG